VKNPELLQTTWAKYNSQVRQFFYALDYLGRNMMGIDSGDLTKIAVDIQEGRQKYNSNRDEVDEVFMGVNSILNLLSPEKIDRNALLEITRSNLIYREGMHDMSHLLASVDLSGDKPLDDKEKERISQIGYHLLQIGQGGINLISPSSIYEIDLELQVLDGVESFFRTKGGERLEIEYEWSNQIEFDGDASNLYRCAWNIANNAMIRGKATKLRISATESDSEVHIQFADNGIGLPNVDDIFQYGNSSTGGKGLGLFLVKYVVEAHGGSVAAIAHNDDPVYKGAAFTINLPKKNSSGAVYYPSSF